MVDGELLEAVQLEQAPIDRHVAHKVKRLPGIPAIRSNINARDAPDNPAFFIR